MSYVWTEVFVTEDDEVQLQAGEIGSALVLSKDMGPDTAKALGTLLIRAAEAVESRKEVDAIVQVASGEPCEECSPVQTTENRVHCSSYAPHGWYRCALEEGHIARHFHESLGSWS